MEVNPGCNISATIFSQLTIRLR